MTDINIVRKTPAVLPWLIGLGLVLLAVALWISWDRGTDAAFVTGRGDPSDRPRAEADLMSGRTVPAEVAAYQSFAESPEAAPAGLSHDYAATGIRRLSGALRSVAGPDAVANEQLSQRLATFEEKADRLQADAQSLNHANVVRDVFVSAVDVMASIQDTRAPGSSALKSQIADLRRSAESIDARRPLLDQNEPVTRFFDQSADALAMLAKQ